MFKYLILLLFLCSCVNLPFTSKKKLGESDRDYLYRKQGLQLNLGEIQREAELETIPSASEINEYLNNKLTPTRPDCYEEITEIPIEEDKELSIEEKLEKNFLHLGGDKTSLKQAMCFFNKHKDAKFLKKKNKKYTGSTSIKNKDYMVIQDFNQPSSKKRLFLLNLKTGEVETYFSSHGIGTENGLNNPALMAENFSNESGSNLTPRGFMVSAERVNGLASGWKWHMKFDGLQKDINDNNRDRLIVFHQGVSKDGKRRTVWDGKADSSQVDPHLYQRSSNGQRIYKKWAQGMTWGCTAVASEHVDEVYEKTKGGALFYNYTSEEKKAGSEYCGSNPLLKD